MSTKSMILRVPQMWRNRSGRILKHTLSAAAVVALALTAALALSSCNVSSVFGRAGIAARAVAQSGQGQLSLSVTDTPVDGVKKVEVAFTSVELKGPHGIVTEHLGSEQVVNLLALQGNASSQLLDGVTVDAGDYQWIRLNVDLASSYVLLDNGKQYPLTIPSGSQTGLQLDSGFTVAAGSKSDFVIDFDLRRSLVTTTTGTSATVNYILKPALRLSNMQQVGQIAGYAAATMKIAGTPISASACSPAVYVYEGNGIVPDGYNVTVAGGTPPLTSANLELNASTGNYQYTVGFLAPGSYTLAVTCAADDTATASGLAFSPLRAAAVIANSTTQVDFGVPAGSVAIINPDHYRILKFAYGKVDSTGTFRYYSIPYGTAAGDHSCHGGWTNPSCWSGVGTRPDFIGTILANNGYTVTYYTTSNLPAITAADYNLVIVEDPLQTYPESFPKSVETSVPDLLPTTTSPNFINTIRNYFTSGGRLLLVGPAVGLLGDTAPSGGSVLDFGKTINAVNIANTLQPSSSVVPGKWLFIRGNPFCGVRRNGSGTYSAAAGPLASSGAKLADLTLFDGSDLPKALTWSDTVYSPSDGIPLLDVKVQGSGQYVLNGSICNPPVYHDTVNGTLNDFMGYTTYRGRKIYYIGSDSFFDYKVTDYDGTWHTGSYQRIQFATTNAGQLAIAELVGLAQSH